MKFDIIDTKYGGYRLSEQWKEYLIEIGEIFLFKESRKSESHVTQNEKLFEYHGIQNALCGKTLPSTFTPKRFIVIQMI